MASITMNGINLYYEIHGKGAPLFLVAGLASDSQSWQPIRDDLSSRFQVVVFDNRGVGRTTPQETVTSISRMTDDCIGLARHLGFSFFNLLGHSMGGFIALDCAIRYPEYIDQMILAATSSYASKRNKALISDWISYLDCGMDLEKWYRNFFYWLFTPRFFENEAMVAAATQFAIQYPYPQSKTAFKNQAGAIADFNCSSEVSKITARTLVIGGQADLFFPPEETSRLAQAIPGAQFALIDEAAHSIFFEKPKEFSKRVLDFLLDANN